MIVHIFLHKSNDLWVDAKLEVERVGAGWPAQRRHEEQAGQVEQDGQENDRQDVGDDDCAVPAAGQARLQYIELVFGLFLATSRASIDYKKEMIGRIR